MEKTQENLNKQIQELLLEIQFGMSRDEVVEKLGDPTDWSRPTKRRRQPAILKYNDIELHFTDGWNGTLWMLFAEDFDGNPVVYK